MSTLNSDNVYLFEQLVNTFPYFHSPSGYLDHCARDTPLNASISPPMMRRTIRLKISIHYRDLLYIEGAIDNGY